VCPRREGAEAEADRGGDRSERRGEPRTADACPMIEGLEYEHISEMPSTYVSSSASASLGCARPLLALDDALSWASFFPASTGASLNPE